MTVKEPSVIYRDLDSDAVYHFKVRVRVKGVDSEYSAPIEAMTGLTADVAAVAV